MHQEHLLTLKIDEKNFVKNILPGVDIQVLFIDESNGVWTIYARFEPNSAVSKHFHTGPVHFFTTKGKWAYLEYPENPQTAGSYLYEPGGSRHTLQVGDEGAEGFIVMYSANIDFDQDDNFLNVTDAGYVLRRAYEAAKEQGIEMPRHIVARAPEFSK